jgi:drug/metabolite transporter (DMT)-like permease
VNSRPATVAGHPWRGYLYIAAATFCWGAAATVGKAVFNGSLFAGRAQISPLLLTQARTTFSVLVLGLFLLARFGRDFLKITPRDLILCVLAGTLGVAGSNFFYYLAIAKATVAIAITLQYTAAVWVLTYMVLRGRERATWSRVLSVALAMVGIALTIGLFQSGLKFNAAGVAAALMASFSFAFYNIVAPSLVKRHHQLKVMLYAVLGAALLWAFINPPWRLVAQQYDAGQWGFLFAFACLSLLLPYGLYFNGLRYIDATRAVIASCLEPVFAVLFAAAFVGESVRGSQLVGILAVLAATVMAQVGGKAQIRQAGLKD